MGLTADADRLKNMRARAIATRNRIAVRRARSEAVLAEILPATPVMGMSYHVISHGDVDALSYVAHCVAAWPLDALMISTWCMARPDLDRIVGWVNQGRVGRADFLVGEIFPTQYPDEMVTLRRLAKHPEFSVKVARNHSKVSLGWNADEQIAFAIESSANVNTNPRIEQTALHMNGDLVEFYRDFFDGIRSIDRG